MPRKSTKIEQNGYELSLKVMGKTVSVTGTSVLDALNKLQVFRSKGSMGILTVSHGTKKAEKVLSRVLMKNLFSMSNTVREVAIKNIARLFYL